jgi:hypothetical protein
MLGRDSTVGIVTYYGLDGSGFEPLWGQGFSLLHICPDWPQGPPNLSYNGYTVFFLGKKWLGCGINDPPHLVLRLRMGRVIHVLHLCACICSLWGYLYKTCYTVMCWPEFKIVASGYD